MTLRALSTARRRRAWPAIIAIALLSAGCAYSPASLPVIEPDRYEGAKHTVIVATSRAKLDDPLLRFGDARSDDLSFEEIEVWTPSSRKPGSVAYPSKKPKPDKEFAVLSINPLDAETFKDTLRRRVADEDSEKRVFIFVHGYNVPYANGIYRHAQLMEDFDASGVALHFSWPSSGRSLGYLYDRDSVQFARDGLVNVLVAAGESGADTVFLMGHSMGTLLVMEALRQLNISGQTDVIEKIRPLVLASPDIDVDVFRSQMNALERRPDPIVVFVSQKDGALKLSERLRGGRSRVGYGSNIEELRENGIVVIDLSELDVGEGTNHSAFASSPELIRALQQANVAEVTQRSADRPRDPMAPLNALRDLTEGIVFLPERK
ncbi:MAG: alpha/beta fold hydrolase [Pseudomonadota bacterium]